MEFQSYVPDFFQTVKAVLKCAITGSKIERCKCLVQAREMSETADIVICKIVKWLNYKKINNDLTMYDNINNVEAW